MIIYAVQWSVLSVQEEPFLAVNAELPHAELLRNAVQGSSSEKYGYLR